MVGIQIGCSRLQRTAMDRAFVNTTTVSFLVTVTAFLYFLGKKLRVQEYVNEPSYIPSLIPYFGHALGPLRHKIAYYKNVK